MSNIFISHWPLLCIVAAGVLGVIGAFGTYIHDSEKNEQLINSQNKNIQLAEENAKISKTLYNQFTGGDSFLTVVLVDDYFSIEVHGEHSLIDVNFRLTDVAKQSKIVNKHKEKTKLSDLIAQRSESQIINQNYKRLIAKENRLIPIGKLIDLEVGESKEFRFDWDAMNGESSGFLYINKVSDNLINSALYAHNLGGELYEYPSNYPKLENTMTPDWSKQPFIQFEN